jgi:hypothetical protein
MGLPNINIEFKTTGITAIERSQKGTVALILREESLSGAYRLTNVTEIPEGLTEENKAYIERAFIGYQTPPRTVLIYIIGAEAEISTALTYFATQQFDYICLPPTGTSEEAETLKSWVLSERLNNNAIYKAVLPNLEADSEAIINVTSEGMTDGEKTYTAAEYCSRVAGLIAGTPMNISCTYAPLTDLNDITRLTKAEADEAIDQGKFIFIHDGEKVKVGRGVNSFVTTVEGKGEAYKKIKIVEAIDMINHDIRTTVEDSYIGKYSNSYDNKCILITAIKGYFEQLEMDGILDKGKTSVNIDMEAQENYLKSQGIDTSVMKEQEIKEANTGSKVFIAASIKILDAIEDIDINIAI